MALVWRDVSSKTEGETRTFGSLLSHYVALKAVRWLGKRQRRKLEADALNVKQVQEATLLRRLRKNANTCYGKRFDFCSIKGKNRWNCVDGQFHYIYILIHLFAQVLILHLKKIDKRMNPTISFTLTFTVTLTVCCFRHWQLPGTSPHHHIRALPGAHQPHRCRGGKSADRWQAFDSCHDLWDIGTQCHAAEHQGHQQWLFSAGNAWC